MNRSKATAKATMISIQAGSLPVLIKNSTNARPAILADPSMDPEYLNGSG